MAIRRRPGSGAWNIRREVFLTRPIIDPLLQSTDTPVAFFPLLSSRSDMAAQVAITPSPAMPFATSARSHGFPCQRGHGSRAVIPRLAAAITLRPSRRLKAVRGRPVGEGPLRLEDSPNGGRSTYLVAWYRTSREERHPMGMIGKMLGTIELYRLLFIRFLQSMTLCRSSLRARFLSSFHVVLLFHSFRPRTRRVE